MTGWPFDPLRPLSFGAIIADPPWAYEMRSDAGYDKSPEAHYETMPEAEISALPVGDLAGGDCLLWLWSTWPHLPQALRVMEAWGFTYKTGGSWTKTTRTGKRAFGTGYILRSTTEPFLIGTIGEPKIRSKSVRNLIESERREHSRKPPEAREMIEKLLPDVFACELFAREKWPGNQVWGNERAKFSVGEPAIDDDATHGCAMGVPLAPGHARQTDHRLARIGGDAGVETGLSQLALPDFVMQAEERQRDILAAPCGSNGSAETACVITGDSRSARDDQGNEENQFAHGSQHSETGPSWKWSSANPGSKSGQQIRIEGG